MSEYIIEFTKTGTICYTSHLDLMRIFKRAFKRTGIPLAYSQGFNPHPKMGFAQPLSLGYRSRQEFIEFETAGETEAGELMQRLAEGMPEGIELVSIMEADSLKKTLASHTREAVYSIEIPCEDPASACAVLSDGYMKQDHIEAMKRQKKSKELKAVDIRPMIREICFSADGPDEGVLLIRARLDCGSGSNLSPELVVDTALRFAGIAADRAEIDITREEILFDLPLPELLEGGQQNR